MKSEVYAVRITPQTRLALEALAAGKKVKPRTLVQLMIVSELQRQGYLPRQQPTRRTQAARA